MKIDTKDVATIVAASFGFLLGSLVAFALDANYVLLWQFGGLVVGAAVAAGLLSTT